jgi:putative heme transporter
VSTGDQGAERTDEDRAKRKRTKRIVGVSIGAAFVGLTFVVVLPRIADYGDVGAVVADLSWRWILALLGVAALSLVALAPPWQVALPGLRFRLALALTQAASALSTVVPGGGAVAAAGSYAALRTWAFAPADIARAMTLTVVWNQLTRYSFPIVALFLLTASGGSSAALATAAFVGVAIFGVTVAGLALILLSERLARDLGDVAARFASWALGKVRRGPVDWDGETFRRFRRQAVVLLRRRWHLLTLTTLISGLSLFLVLVVALRAVGVSASEVSLVEAFAAWSLIRLLTALPTTPGDVGTVELGLTAALLGFGGNNAGVVAAVLVYRFLTLIPTLALGLGVAATWRAHHPARRWRAVLRLGGSRRS